MSTTQTTTSKSRPTSNEDTQKEGEPQQLDSVIIRCDGSYHRKGNLATIGFIIENNGGEVVEKHHCPIESATTSTQTEAHACLEAIQAAKKYEPSALFLYSDCQPVVEKIKCGDPTDQRDVYHSVRHEIDSIQHVSINHTKRKYNEEAHRLAHLSLRKLKNKK